jgi:hypothetical protein
LAEWPGNRYGGPIPSINAISVKERFMVRGGPRMAETGCKKTWACEAQPQCSSE